MWKLLGILLGSLAIISLIKEGFDISLNRIPASIYYTYTSARDILFEPLAWILYQIGYTIPPHVKDLTALYVLLIGAHIRGVGGHWYNELETEEYEREQLHIESIISAIIWPVWLVRSFLIWRQFPFITSGDMEESLAPDMLANFGKQIFFASISVIIFWILNFI